jgi:hypothetical protein
LAELSGQTSGKIRPLRKNRPPPLVNLYFFDGIRAFGKECLFLLFEENVLFMALQPLPFLYKKFANKIRAADLSGCSNFCSPSLGYAAEQSASGNPDLNQPSLLRVSHHDFSAGLANHKFPEPSRQKYENKKVEEKFVGRFTK